MIQVELTIGLLIVGISLVAGFVYVVFCIGRNLGRETTGRETTEFKLPEYRCPHCGSRNIECHGYCTISLYQGKIRKMIKCDGIDACQPCKCTKCGATGILRMWVVVN